MKKLNKKDYLYLSILFTFIIGYILVLYIKGYVFGSNIDWLNQHIVVPEYFRNLFYSSKKLNPQLALNLGMGQNIYYFSYYGFLSPFILLSYLLPFIPMYIYIPFISIISLFISIILFYTWIKDKYNNKVAFITSLLFMLNSTFLFHFHRHIMFVIYMPFLLGALKSVDLYFEKKKRLPLIIFTFLMIMSSYYFSVFGIISIGVYTLYKIFKNKKFNIKPLLNIIYFVFIAILLSGILIIPTFYVITSGRSDTATSNAYTILNLLSPIYNYKSTFYYTYYSWGVTFIYIISIINGLISKKKEQIFLNIIISIMILFPLCSYLFNGLMYIDGKCFIPFLPVVLLSISNYINDALNKKINSQKLLKILIPVSLFLIIIALKASSIKLLIADITCTLLCLIFYQKINFKQLIFIPTIIITFISFIFSALNDDYVKIDTIKNINNNAYYELSNIKDDNLYRIAYLDNILGNPNKIYNLNNYQSTIYSSTTNQNYFNFVRNIFQNEIVNRDNLTITQTSNILFNIYSGTKYLISSKDALIGYKEIKTINDITLYQNEDVLPIGYASNKIMSLREFEKLEYPYTLDALLNYIIVDKSIDDVYESNIKEYQVKYDITKLNNIEYTNNNNHYLIDAKKNASLQIKLNNPVKDKILIIKFNMNKEKEGYACGSSILINGITNTLSCNKWKYHNKNNTFEYVLSSNETIDTLNIEFSKDKFDISNIEFYTLDYSIIKNLNENIDELIIDSKQTTSNKIVGTINATNDGYVKLTIPYEKKGFKIYVDGEKVSKVKTDNTFLGFEITKGNHDILIKYHSPYLKTGLFVSLIGLVLLIITILYEHNEKIYKKYAKKILNILKRLYKQLKKYLINNKGYILLFISLFILDLSLRIFYNKSVDFYHWYKLVPNIFSITWILLTLSLTKIFSNKTGKSIYLIVYILSCIMFLVHAIYFSYFNVFFDFSVLQIAAEGTDYLETVLLNVKLWVIIITIVSIILTVKGLKLIKHDRKTDYIKLIIIILIFIVFQLFTPLILGKKNTEVEWDDWRNARSIYNSFNDNNKSLMVSGMFQYNIRNFYITFIRNNNVLTKSEKDVLEDNFKNLSLAKENKYTNLFKGKNLILVQLESIDSFLLDKNIMPEFYNISKNSINFTNHYSFTSGGGSTFNSEFMVNTGYSSAYNYNQGAYTFSRNTYTYSLANLFKKEGYTVNAFHMNTKEYYSRGVNYKAFGYDSYNGLKDLNIYENNEYWLDTELLNNKKFNQKIFNMEKPFVDYIITYSAHMPYKTTKGTCPLLTEETGLTEEQCLKIQAKETDDFIKLLLDNLIEKNLIDNTVIILFSDHYIYTLENKSILEKYKDTENNLINHTPFIIYDNGNTKLTYNSANSQLDILPTILNLFGIEYYPNNYIGRDILDENYEPLVFFSDGSWYNGKTYVSNGEYEFGKKINNSEIEKYNTIVKRKMLLNDAVIKSDYFAKK